MALRRSRNEAGASATEYGLLIAGIAALVVVAVFLFGGTVRSVFTDSCDTVKQQMESADCS
jgi:pilus assembly protein Flp/PilA